MVGMGIAGTWSPTPEQEHQIIEDIWIKTAHAMKEGDLFYVLSNRWWKEWNLYVGRGARNAMFRSKPGSIDNSDIVLGFMRNNCDIEFELRDGLKEGTDYVLLHKDVWLQLYKWYGGGPILERKLIGVGPFPKQVIVEVYPLRLRLVVVPEEKQFTLKMSRKDTLGELYRRACERFKLRSEQIHIWNFKGRTIHNLLVLCEDQTLEEAKIEMGQEILLEVDRNLGGENNMPVWVSNTVVKRHHSPLWQENDTPVLCLRPPVLRLRPQVLPLPSVTVKRYKSSVVQKKDTGKLPVIPRRARIYASKDNSSSSMEVEKKDTGKLPVIPQWSRIYASNDNSSSSMELDKDNQSSSMEVQKKDTGKLPVIPQWARIYASKDNSSSSMELDNFVQSNGFGSLGSSCDMNSALQHKDSSSCAAMKLKNLVGLKGFKNIGNTCYMNSALQCVLHIPELVHFFQGNYKEHINHANPLGSKGVLVSAFGELLREAWTPGEAFAPRSFKQTFGVLKPNFAGLRQEDAQEFLIVLLDGLHEDLNRVKSKHYTEIDDDNECSVEALADKYHAHHKALEDSIIQDLFGGQWMETLLCTTCGKVKRKFDSFTHLPVTFPKTPKIRVTVFNSDGIEKPAQHTITVDQEGTYQDIVNALSSLCSIRADEKLLLVEISNGQIVRYLDKLSDPFSNTAESVVLAAYRLPVQEKYPLLVLQHQIQSEEGGNLAPLVASLGTKTPTGSNVQAVVRTLLAPMLRTQIREKEDGDVDMECIETSISREEDSSFVLYLADENGNKTQTIIKADEPIPFLYSGERLQVIVEWIEGELKKYETECLSNLPIAKRESEIKITDEDLNLYTMLESMFKEKVLPREEAWFCPQCKEFRQAIKKLDIWTLPEILIVFLVRFHNKGNRTYSVKTLVDFPIDGFDLSKFVANNNETKGYIYKLFAITNHSGSLNGGHYTAHVKVRDGWYNFNDEYVSSINEEDTKTAKAYLLFYRRVHTKENFACGK